MASSSGVTLQNLNSIVLEGGAIEVDQDGVMLATRSAILEPDRNPGLTQAQLQNSLVANLGIAKFIWLNGAPGGADDITDMHIDGFARFGPADRLAAEVVDADALQQAQVVQRQDIGARDQRLCQGHPLALAAREFPHTCTALQAQALQAVFDATAHPGLAVVPALRERQRAEAGLGIDVAGVAQVHQRDPSTRLCRVSCLSYASYSRVVVVPATMPKGQPQRA